MRPLLRAQVFHLFAAVWLPNEPFRFDPSDADAVDSEQRLGTEYFNDELSYEFPERMQREWQSSLSGYRVSAGSLNMREFNFIEDIRLRSKREDDLRFSFASAHRQNLLDDARDREIRLDVRIMSSPWLISIMGEADGTKSFADFGAGFTREGESVTLGADIWAVDYFYNTKTLTSPDQYKTRPRAGKAYVRWQWSTWQGEVQLAEQTKVDWLRVTLDERYSLATRYWLNESRIMVDERDEVRLSLRQDVKNESVRDATASDPFEKTLNRELQSANLSWARSETAKYDAVIGLRVWNRAANYSYSDAEPTQGDDEVEPSKPRREWALYGTHYHYTESGSGWQWGVFWNQMHGGGDDGEDVNEVKLQTAYDWRLGPHANMFWNITWDFDKAARRFPYDEEEFQPWGGGNLQASLLF